MAKDRGMSIVVNDGDGSTETKLGLKLRRKNRDGTSGDGKSSVKGTSELAVGVTEKMQDNDANLIECFGEIGADDVFFRQRVNLIPSELYVAKEKTPEEEESEWKKRKGYMKNKKMRAPKEAVKSASKRAKRAKLKVKPNTKESQTATTRAIAEQHQHETSTTSQSRDDQPETRVSKFNFVFSNEQKQPPARNLKELNERLQRKLEALKKRREGSGKRKKRKQEREMARKKNNEEAKKPKHKSSHVKSETKENEDSKATTEKPTSKSAKMKTTDPYKNQQLSETIKDNIINYGRLNVGGKLLDSAGEVAEASNTNGIKGNRNILNVKKLLEKAQKNQTRIMEMKASKEKHLRGQAEAEKWDEMEGLAAGRIDPKRTNPKMLKKKLKRLEKEKAKKGKKWRERVKQVKDSQAEKAERKRANVEQHNKKKTESRLKRKGITVQSSENGEKEKRKRRRPGFEGKHHGFLNKNAKGNVRAKQKDK